MDILQSFSKHFFSANMKKKWKVVLDKKYGLYEYQNLTRDTVVAILLIYQNGHANVNHAIQMAFLIHYRQCSNTSSVGPSGHRDPVAFGERTIILLIDSWPSRSLLLIVFGSTQPVRVRFLIVSLSGLIVSRPV